MDMCLLEYVIGAQLTSFSAGCWLWPQWSWPCNIYVLHGVCTEIHISKEPSLQKQEWSQQKFYVTVWHYIRLKSCDKIIWTILQFMKSVGMTLDVLISLWNWTIVFITWSHVLLLGRWSVRQDIKTRKGEVMKAVSDILKKNEGGGG